MWETVHIYYREDATGPVARYAGQRASTAAMPRSIAEGIIAAAPNGSQMEIREEVSR